MKVSFIGLGIMGSRMAMNLVKAGVDLTVFNRSKAPMQALESAGAKTAISYQAAVEEADVVFTMLSTPQVVEEVALGTTGFVQAMKPHALWVDCSIVNPSFTTQMAAASQELGIQFMDAPVAGTLPHAQNGELVFFVGGTATQIEKVQHLLDAMGKKTVHVGTTSKGSSLKMLVNAMLAQSMLIFSETVILGEKMGLDKAFLLDFLPNLVVAPPFTKAKANMIKSDSYEVMFPLEWMHKDMQLVTQTAYELNQPLYLANLTKELFQSAKQQGLGRLDFAAIHRFLESK